VKKPYVIRREDFFQAVATKQLPPDVAIGDFGSIWVTVFLTDTARKNYTFPIDPA